jgi:hypothetical protein
LDVFHTREADEMACEWRESARQFRNAFLLSAISTAVVSCGGGGDEPASRTAVLEWEAVSDANLAGYRVYYGTSSGTYDQARGQGLGVGNVTVFTVGGLNSGTRYYFAATAVDTLNNESTFSNEVWKDIP